MTTVVLLNSGGVDSRVVAAMLKASDMEIHSLFIDWHFGVSAEAGAAAKLTADTYAVDHEVIRFPLDWTRWHDRLGRRWFPFTGPTAIAIGSSYAGFMEAEWLAVGVRRESYTDHTWPEAAQRLLATSGITKPIALLLPVYDMDDAQVAAKGVELGVDMDTTWTCTASPQCGTCRGCRRRRDQGLWVA